MGLGVATMATTTENTLGDATGEGTLRGGGTMIELLLGGTPAPGLVLGGGLLAHSFRDPTFEHDGTKTVLDSSKMDLSAVGMFGQWYFDPMAGGYIQALVAIASESFRWQEGGQSHQTDELSGLGLGLGGGWDFWVGNQWSLGPELRYVYAKVRHEADGKRVEHRTNALSLAFTATLH
jgi:hypothetical protein